jgi:hypothetical protein
MKSLLRLSSIIPSLLTEKILSKVDRPLAEVERSMPMKIRIKIKTFFSRHFSPARILFSASLR